MHRLDNSHAPSYPTCALLRSRTLFLSMFLNIQKSTSCCPPLFLRFSNIFLTKFPQNFMNYLTNFDKLWRTSTNFDELCRNLTNVDEFWRKIRQKLKKNSSKNCRINSSVRHFGCRSLQSNYNSTHLRQTTCSRWTSSALPRPTRIKRTTIWSGWPGS